MSQPHVVIVGAGFAGVSAVKTLAKAGYRVTVIDRNAYMAFKPLLYQVAIGGLNAGDVTYSLRSFVAQQPGKLVRFRRAQVVHVDADAQRVTLDDGTTVDYDHLLLSQGVSTNYFGIEGAAEHTEHIYTRAAALTVRDTIIGGMERLATGKDPDDRFDIVVAGGGATGVEMAGHLGELVTRGIEANYPEIRPEQVTVTIVEMAPYLLAPFDASLRDYTKRVLEEKRVDVRLDSTIASITEDAVTLKDGTTLPSDITIWTAGIGPWPEVKEWGFAAGRGGRISTEKTLQVKGLTNVFAAGDGAITDDEPLPQLAQPAMQGGAFVAEQIIRLEKGEPLEEFSYFDKGSMAIIARASAVAQLGAKGPKFTGIIAWVMWLFIHIVYLLGGRNRLSALISLSVRYFGWPKNAASIVGDPREPGDDDKGSRAVE